MSAAAVLEHRDRIGTGTARVFALAQLKQVGSHGVGSDRAADRRDDEVTALVDGCLPGVDEDLGAGDDVVVDLAVIGQERADAVEMGAGTQQGALDQWITGHRGGRDHVGTVHCGVEIIDHYVGGAIYPDGLTRETQWVIAGVLLTINAVLYGLMIARVRRSGRQYT